MDYGEQYSQDFENKTLELINDMRVFIKHTVQVYSFPHLKFLL